MPQRNRGTILIVEDEPELRFILGAHLRASGFEVLNAIEGGAAIEIATKHLPDLIIMDIGLPGINGISATRTLKADRRTADIPVIMLTARSGSRDVVEGLEAGAQEYLSKPFDVAELLARVESVHRLATAHKDLDRLNTKLEAEVDAKTRRLQLLYEFMRDLNHSGSQQEIIDLLTRCVEQTTGARRISLFLRDATGEKLKCACAVGVDRRIVKDLEVKSIEGITGQVYRSGKTLAAKAYGAERCDRNYEQNHFVSAPLISAALETRDGVIGVLNVTDKEDGGTFVEEEIECIRSVADAAAIALDNLLRRDRLQRSVHVLLRTVGQLAEYRDEETNSHLERVAQFARILAQSVGSGGPYAAMITSGFVDSLVQAAPMHDIGKVGISDEILTKPGRLTDEEFQIMKTHTDIGRRVLSEALDPAHPVPLLQMCIDIAHGHHERYDGAGYPRRVKGTNIPLSARIVALVDAYDAITSARRYKDAQSHGAAAEIIRSEAGKHFDPILVEAFLRCEDEFAEIRRQYDESEMLTPVQAS